MTGIIDQVVLNTLHIAFPILVYGFFVAYKNTFDEREHDLALFIMIFSLMYIIIRYNTPLIKNLPMMMINIPLIISYMKRKNIAIIVCSFVIVFYLYSFYSNYLILLVFEYLIYMFIYILRYNNFKITFFLPFFSLIKVIFMILVLFLEDNYLNEIMYIIVLGFFLWLFMYMVVFLIIKFDQVLKMHKTFKETLESKEIRNSLFKITHEIKNPIAVCKGYLDMINTKDKSQVERYIPIIKEEVGKTLLLLDDFLSMNKLKLKKDILDINLLLEELLDNYSLYLKEKKVRVIKRISPDEIYVDGDYDRLTQVFVNIIKNSVEAMDGDGFLKVVTKEEDGFVLITFKDNGIGMNEDVLGKIKEPFFTTKKNGNGLGVALSNEIIMAHGGKMDYESRKGVYTVVKIILPVTYI